MTTTTVSSREQAEMYVIEMDMVQSELEQTGDYEVFASCKKSLEMLKSEIVALGFQVERVPTGWKLVEPVVGAEVAQAASTPTVALKEDEQGLYAEVPSSTKNTIFKVRVCARWLHTTGCECAAADCGKDCRHRLLVDEWLRPLAPTFSQWIAGEGASQETINALLSRDRYASPLKGSGVTGWKAASIERKLAA